MTAAIMEVPVGRLDGPVASHVNDFLAVEAPLEIRLGLRSFAVTMRTPGNDLELAAGFLFSENRKPAASSRSLPGVRMVTAKLRNTRRISRGASTARKSFTWDATGPSRRPTGTSIMAAVICPSQHSRWLTLPAALEHARCPACRRR